MSTHKTIVHHNSVAKENTQILLEAVLNEDAELFCPYVKETYPDLEEQIEDWMSFIDGDIVSYDEPTWSLGRGETKAEEGIILQAIGGGADNVKTSTGRIYRIGYGGYSANKEKPEYVGVTDIVIFAEEVYIPNAGRFEKEVYRLAFSEMWD